METTAAGGGLQAAAPDCVYHAGVHSAEACQACGWPFCEGCLVEFQGRRLCGGCKNGALASMVNQKPRPNSDARDAFIMALLGMVVLGVILQPLALIRGTRALKKCKEDPSLGDRWRATAAVAISCTMITIY